MSALADALRIAFFDLGTPLLFHAELVPDFVAASRVIYAWITDILYVVSPSHTIHGISTKTARIRLIPLAALLGYMLDRLRGGSQATSPSAQLPTKLWYGKQYDKHARTIAPYDDKMPGALLYLR